MKLQEEERRKPGYKAVHEKQNPLVASENKGHHLLFQCVFSCFARWYFAVKFAFMQSEKSKRDRGNDRNRQKRQRQKKWREGDRHLEEVKDTIKVNWMKWEVTFSWNREHTDPKDSDHLSCTETQPWNSPHKPPQLHLRLLAPCRP